MRWHWLFNGPMLAMALVCFLYGLSSSANDPKETLMYFYSFYFGALAFAGLRPVLRRHKTNKDEQIDERALLELTEGFLPDTLESEGRVPESSGKKLGPKEKFSWVIRGDITLTAKRPYVAMSQSGQLLHFHDVEFMSKRIPRLIAGMLGTRLSRTINTRDIVALEYVKVHEMTPRSGGDHLIVHLPDGYFRMRKYHYPDFYRLKEKLSLLSDFNETRGSRDTEALNLLLFVFFLLLMAFMYLAFVYIAD